MIEPTSSTGPPVQPHWAKLIDHTRCIGCHACTTACKAENEVPLGVNRTFVKCVESGTFPHARRSYQVTRCNQCADAPCTAACPTAAMHARPDGIVDFDKSVCIGCKACIAACPYDAIFINPDDQTAEKCNFCAHRIDVGLEPACVVVCPTQAILVGDLADPASPVAASVRAEPLQVRRPEKATRPHLFYRGAGRETLDPLQARRPGGGLFLWGEQRSVPGAVVGGHPGAAPDLGWGSSAAALLVYDAPHRAPWDWRVSLYTVTKAIAAGAYLAVLALVLAGRLAGSSPLWVWGAPLLAVVFLGLTGALLIADLSRPLRFWLILVRPQWRSWLVRGAFLILGYGVALAAHLAAALAGRVDLLLPIAVAGAPLALGAALYTAFLFAQSRGRDLWQSRLAAPHLAIQTLLAGAGAAIPVALATAGEAVDPLAWMLFGSLLLHLALLWREVASPHDSAHARLAVWEMVHGSYRRFFLAGGVLAAVALAAPWVTGSAPAAGVAIAAVALVGLFLHEHAWVQAGQAVPLA